MAIQLIDTSQEQRVASQYDPAKNDDDKTWFTIKAMDSRMSACLKDKSMKMVVDTSGDAEDEEVDMQINQNELDFNTVMFNLTSHENLQGKDKKIVKFKKGSKGLAGATYSICHPEQVRLIPDTVLAELAGKIRAMSTLGAGEEKNS